jgi:hypothetical protein
MKSQASRPDDLVSGCPSGVTLHPTQFRGLWNGGHGSPEREVAMAVIENAVTDLLRHRYARGRYRQRMYWQAHQWVASSDWDWPFSFVNICEYLRLSAEAPRARLLRAGDGRGRGPRGASGYAPIDPTRTRASPGETEERNPWPIRRALNLRTSQIVSLLPRTPGGMR